MSREIHQKIAHHFSELSKYFAMLANEPNGQPDLIPMSHAVKCDCGKLAATHNGIASKGPKQGKPFIKYFCAENRCDFKKFEDA